MAVRVPRLRHGGRVAARAAGQDYRSKDPKDVTVAVFGSTGYIGRKVTEEMISRGFNVVAVAREQSGIGGKQGRSEVQAMFPAATVKFSDVTDVERLKKDVFDSPVDVVVCCLASRTGGIKDSWLVDYQVRLPRAAATAAVQGVQGRTHAIQCGPSSLPHAAASCVHAHGAVTIAMCCHEGHPPHSCAPALRRGGGPGDHGIGARLC